MHADTVSFGEYIAMGHVAGVSQISKIGYVTGVEATEVDIWAVGGTFVFPTAAMGMEVVLSSAQDTATTGTGARTVKIWYLDSSFVEKTETITLNGTNAVATAAKDIYRINNFWVMSAGTGGKSAGDIDIRHLSDTPVYSRIPTGTTRARNAMYTVPYGKKLYIWQITYASSSGTGKDVRFTLRSNYNMMESTISTLYYAYSEIGIQDTTFTITYTIPMMFPTGSDIKVSAISVSGAAATCSVQYRGALLK